MKSETLIKELKQINGATFGQLVTCTTPILTGGKSNPLQGRVTKVTTQNVQIGTDYEAAVNRQAGREANSNQGAFKSQGLPEGQTWVIPKKVIQKKSGLQMRYTIQNHKKPKVEYFLDGKPIDKSEIEHCLPKRYSSAKQKEFGNEAEIKPRDVKFENIISLKIRGKIIK